MDLGTPHPIPGMVYMEVPEPGRSAVCSDDKCPCPEVPIARGEGYMYVSEELAELRRRCPSLGEIKAWREQLGENVMFGGGTLSPVLTCEQGARLRNLDMTVAAQDAQWWWKTGQVPCRPTPTRDSEASPAGQRLSPSVQRTCELCGNTGGDGHFIAYETPSARMREGLGTIRYSDFKPLQIHFCRTCYDGKHAKYIQRVRFGLSGFVLLSAAFFFYMPWTDAETGESVSMWVVPSAFALFGVFWFAWFTPDRSQPRYNSEEIETFMSDSAIAKADELGRVLITSEQLSAWTSGE